MEIIKYMPNFILEIGKDYEVSLKEETIKKLLEFKKKVNSNKTINTETNKDINENKWRDNNKVKLKTKEDFKKDIYLQLNKLSETNVETISYQINNIINELDISIKEEVVDSCIERLFNSARLQINFCHLYANLFYKLINLDKVTFSKKISDKIKYDFTTIDKMEQLNSEGDYNKYCNSINIKDNYIGCYQFCIELYSNYVITYTNLEQIIKNILLDLNNQDEKYKLEIIIECLCRIIKTINKSKRIKENEKKVIISKINHSFELNIKKLNSRSRFLFEDVIKDIISV